MLRSLLDAVRCCSMLFYAVRCFVFYSFDKSISRRCSHIPLYRYNNMITLFDVRSYTLSTSSMMHCAALYLPQVEDIIREAQKKQKRVRVVGNALSPNGIGLSEDTMLSLGQCDRVLHIDQEMKTVTIEVIKNTQQ